MHGIDTTRTLRPCSVSFSQATLHHGGRDGKGVAVEGGLDLDRHQLPRPELLRFVAKLGLGAAWLAVVLGACSTWLSFGLLALSSTPALRSFGLTLMFGILIVWLATPLYRSLRVSPTR